MTDHYMRLLTDIELNDNQKHIWYRVVETLLGTDNSVQPENFLDKMTSRREELEGDVDFPYVYVVYINDVVAPSLAEKIVYVWNEIYPRDFLIEMSAEYNQEDCDCEVEIDDSMFEEIQHRANKFLHNRWVESQISQGWRFGLHNNVQEKTNPSLRDWDSLHEDYRREVALTREQATEFFKKYPHIFA